MTHRCKHAVPFGPGEQPWRRLLLDAFARTMLGVLAFAAVSPPLRAQENPATRVQAFAATPNWTGIWETEIAAAAASGELERKLNQGPPAETPPTTASPQGAPPPTPLERAVIGSIQLAKKPPYNAEWEQKYETAARSPRPGPPGKVCSAATFPLNMEIPVGEGMFQVLVTPEQVVLIFAIGGVRQIYTDGRSHPKAEDMWPTDMGDSIGHWEGGTLVIDTIGRKAGPLRPGTPMPTTDLSEQAHFVERLRMIAPDTLQNDMTIEDPQRLAHPWKVAIRYRRVTDIDRLIPASFNCDVDRNVVVNGKMTIKSP